MKKQSTLIIDMDPQSNTSISLMDLETVETSVYDALIDPPTELKDAIYETPIENLHLIPSNISLAKLESKLLGEIDAHFRLRDRLSMLRSRYEYIIIDTPPTLGLITVNALVAASHLLIPIQSSYYALEGTGDLLETMDKVKARPNPDLRLLGILITLHDRRTTLSRDVRKKIKESFGEKVFKTVINKNVRLEESPAHKEAIFSFAPRSRGAYEYYSLSEEVIARV